MMITSTFLNSISKYLDIHLHTLEVHHVANMAVTFMQVHSDFKRLIHNIKS